MTKAEAAEALGVSTRAVERYVAAGRLTRGTARGATGRVLDLDAGEVERLAVELNTPQAPTLSDSPDATRPDVPETAIVKVPQQARTLAQPAQPEGAAQMMQVLAALLEEARQDATRQAATGRPVVPVEARLTLSLDEAAALSGVPRSMLRAAISDGSLAAKKLGRGWKVRRSELLRWIEATC